MADVDVVTVINGDLAVVEVQSNMSEFYQYQDKLSMHQPKHFDAIILDLNMPIMNGYEACKQIR